MFHWPFSVSVVPFIFCILYCFMVMSRDQNAGRSHNIKIDNSSYERVDEFRNLETTLTNQNSIQE